MKQLSNETRARILSALVEGNSIRSTERMVGANRETITKLLVDVGAACETMHDAMVRGVNADFIECDEIWSFIGAKQGHLMEDHPAEFGDCYTWIGMDANTKLVISYIVGKRDGGHARVFAWDLRGRVVGKPQISTDGLEAYVPAIEEAFGNDCHYGMIVKEYAGDSSKRQDAAHRYSPGRVIGAQQFAITGHPIPERISTSYIERQNLTCRMMMRRFTRLTNAFSKKLANHRAAVALHFVVYNFVRVHQSLRVTPAMQAGLTDHVWSMGELVDFVMTLPVAA
jgi:IS1 family transposase